MKKYIKLPINRFSGLLVGVQGVVKLKIAFNRVSLGMPTSALVDFGRPCPACVGFGPFRAASGGVARAFTRHAWH